MENQPNTESSSSPSTAPAPEALSAQSSSAGTLPPAADAKPATPLRSRRGSYKPSHKATFIGLAAVVAILAINGVIIGVVLKGRTEEAARVAEETVTLSPSTLQGLGINKTPLDNAGTELIVGPNSRFRGTLTVGKDVSIAGQLKLNSKFSATEAALAKLDAGDTSLNTLAVNGDATATNLVLRKDLTVAGATRLQGPVTVSQLMTINNNLNVAGSVAIGGTLTVRTFQASSLTSDTTLTIGGHIITRGSAPSISQGPAMGPTGTVSISGNDAAGTIGANAGVGAPGGIVASITFRQPYLSIPRVVVTTIGGSGVGSVYVNRSATGFSVGINGAVPPGGYAFDYIVMQ